MCIRWALADRTFPLWLSTTRRHMTELMNLTAVEGLESIWRYEDRLLAQRKNALAVLLRLQGKWDGRISVGTSVCRCRGGVYCGSLNFTLGPLPFPSMNSMPAEPYQGDLVTERRAVARAKILCL